MPLKFIVILSLLILTGLQEIVELGLVRLMSLLGLISTNLLLEEFLLGLVGVHLAFDLLGRVLHVLRELGQSALPPVFVRVREDEWVLLGHTAVQAFLNLELIIHSIVKLFRNRHFFLREFHVASEHFFYFVELFVAVVHVFEDTTDTRFSTFFT
jgi:hypothetical protein